jgi:DNA-binding response OmpR family regulator
MRILILDDDELLLRMISGAIFVLKPEAQVVTTLCQKDALAALDKNNVDMLIIDRHGCGGCLVGVKAKEMGVRVVLCTGDHQQSLEFEEVLFKPFTLDELEALLR